MIQSDDESSSSSFLYSAKTNARFEAVGENSEYAPKTLYGAVENPDEILTFLCWKIPRRIRNEIVVGLLMILVILVGTCQSVSARIKAESMGPYNAMTSLASNLVYVVVFFTFLFVRIGCGFAHKRDLYFPWQVIVYRNSKLKGVFYYEMNYFINLLTQTMTDNVKGAMDGLATVLAMIAYDSPQSRKEKKRKMTAMVTQTNMLFLMISAVVMLRTKYTYWQLWGSWVTLGGAIICLFMENGYLGQSDIVFAIIMMLSTLPSAISYTTKELIFHMRPKLDLFIINSHAAVVQLLLGPALLSLVLIFDNITPSKSYGQFLKEGFRCFIGHPDAVKLRHQCAYTPYSLLAYIIINTIYLVLLLLLIKRASALLSFMAIKAVVPFSVLAFFINWPLIGKASFNPYIIIGLITIISGLVFYRLASYSKELNGKVKGYGSCCSVRMSLKKVIPVQAMEPDEPVETIN